MERRMRVFVTLIETDGNQRYIFATNRLRQNVGASELIFRVCTQVVLEAAVRAGAGDCWRSSTTERARRLVDPACNRRIEDGADCEVVVATSGRAILLTRSLDRARAVVRDVTAWGAKQAPGLSVAGATAECDLGAGPVHEVIRRLARTLPRVRGTLPAPESRFLRWPVVADCATSGLPASVWARPTGGEDAEPQSNVAQAKYRQAQQALERLQSQVARDQRLPASIEEIERQLGEVSWLGVVHADGNGLGKVFIDLDRHLQASQGSGNRAYLDGLRRFSLGLELCTESAFRRALVVAASHVRDDVAPVVPLVLGGDDFTALCDGRSALPLARTFLEAFEQEAASDTIEPVGDIVAQVTRAAFGVPRLSACAGVALVKPHSPFYAAYDLAEALLAAAKTVKWTARDSQGGELPCSALDFHLLAAGSAGDLGLVRGERTSQDGRARLWGGPYVVTPASALAQVADQGWLTSHELKRLEERVRAIVDRDEEGRRRLPGTVVQDLRAAVFEGKDIADRSLQLVLPRYQTRGLAALIEAEAPGSSASGQAPSLFRRESESADATVFVTSYLDVLDAAELRA